MERTCRKCGNPLVAQRKTKQYCGANCRSAYGQRVRRGTAVANPLSPTEAFLLEFVLRVGTLTESIWTEMRTGTERLSIANIENLGRCSAIASSEQIQALRARYEQQRMAGKRNADEVP